MPKEIKPTPKMGYASSLGENDLLEGEDYDELQESFLTKARKVIWVLGYFFTFSTTSCFIVCIGLVSNDFQDRYSALFALRNCGQVIGSFLAVGLFKRLTFHEDHKESFYKLSINKTILICCVILSGLSYATPYIGNFILCFVVQILMNLLICVISMGCFVSVRIILESFGSWIKNTYSYLMLSCFSAFSGFFVQVLVLVFKQLQEDHQKFKMAYIISGAIMTSPILFLAGISSPKTLNYLEEKKVKRSFKIIMIDYISDWYNTFLSIFTFDTFIFLFVTLISSFGVAKIGIYYTSLFKYVKFFNEENKIFVLTAFHFSAAISRFIFSFTSTKRYLSLIVSIVLSISLVTCEVVLIYWGNNQYVSITMIALSIFSISPLTLMVISYQTNIFYIDMNKKRLAVVFIIQGLCKTILPFISAVFSYGMKSPIGFVYSNAVFSGIILIFFILSVVFGIFLALHRKRIRDKNKIRIEAVNAITEKNAKITNVSPKVSCVAAIGEDTIFTIYNNEVPSIFEPVEEKKEKGTPSMEKVNIKRKLKFAKEVIETINRKKRKRKAMNIMSSYSGTILSKVLPKSVAKVSSMEEAELRRRKRNRSRFRAMAVAMVT